MVNKIVPFYTIIPLQLKLKQIRILAVMPVKDESLLFSFGDSWLL